MTAIPLDGWCIQVFHLGPGVDVSAVAATVAGRITGATCSDGSADGQVWLAVETLDEEPLVSSVRALVLELDPGADPQHVSRPKIDPLLAG